MYIKLGHTQHNQIYPNFTQTTCKLLLKNNYLIRMITYIDTTFIVALKTCFL